MTPSDHTRAATDRSGLEPRLVSQQAASSSGLGLRSKLRLLLAEPLLIFVAIAALIFAGERALRPQDDTFTIVVDASVQSELLAMFAQRQGRAPSPQEAAQLVRRWVDDEVLLREGLKLELPRRDPALRDQLIARVSALLESSAELDTPAEPALRQFYEAHQEDYALGPLVDFTEYVVAADARGEEIARETLRSLQHGHAVTAPPGVATQRSAQQLVELYGRGFADRLLAVPVDSWQLLRSTRALHVVRVAGHTPRQTPAYEQLRERLLQDFRLAQRQRQFAQQLDSLRSAWTVRVEGASP